MKPHNHLLLLACVPALQACGTLGSNIKGDFACKAPGGICSPSSRIDDQALAAMAGADGEDREPASTGTRVFYARPASTSALKIVLPARTDRFGRWREETVVYAELLAGPARSGVRAAQAGEAPAQAQGKSLTELALEAPRADSAPVASREARPLSRQAIEREVAARLARTGAGLPGAPAAAGDTAKAAVPPLPAADPDADKVRAPAFPASSAGGSEE